MRHRKEAVWGHGGEVAISERGQRPCRDPPCQHLDPGRPACRAVGQWVLVVEAPPRSVTFWKGGLAPRDGTAPRTGWWGTAVRAGRGSSQVVRRVLGRGRQAESQEEMGNRQHVRVRAAGPLGSLSRS